MKRLISSAFICLSFFFSYSQNITIGNLEKVLKLDLYETDISLSGLGFSYYSTDSNELCTFHMFRKDEFKKIEEYTTVMKFFCEEIYKIQYAVFNKSIFNSLRDEAVKLNYKLLTTKTDERGLRSTFMNTKNSFFIDFSQGQLKTEDKTYTEYMVELYCLKSNL